MNIQLLRAMGGLGGGDVAREDIFLHLGFANSSDVISYSTDGKTYTGLGKEIHTRGIGVKYINKKFISGGLGRTMGYSVDGKKFIAVKNSPFTTACYGSAYGNGIYVAGGQGGNTLAYSLDGKTWTANGSSIFSTACYNVYFDGTKFWALGAGTANTIATSTDGINWTGKGKTVFSASGNSMTYDNGLYVFSGAGTNTLATSSDGVTITGIGLTIFSDICRDVKYVPHINKYVAVGKGTNTVAYCTDPTAAANWTGKGTAVISVEGVSVANSDTIVCVAGSGTSYYAWSADGINYTNVNASTITISDGRLLFAKKVKNVKLDPSFVITGDSIAAGQVSSQFYLNWVSLVAYEKQFYQYNLAVGGSKSGDIIANILPTLPNKKTENKYFIVATGTNDARTIEISTAQYQANLNTILDTLISKGWDMSNIILPTLYYFTNYGTGNLSRVLACNDIIKNIWVERNMTYRLDMYQHMIDNGGVSLLYTDNLHPNDSGHQVIANLYNLNLI